MSEASSEIPVKSGPNIESTGSTASPDKRGFLERMAALTKAARPETEGEKLKRSVEQTSSANPITNSLERLRIEDTTSNTYTDTNTDKSSSKPKGIVIYKKNRVAIKNELKALEARKAYESATKRPGIIKAGNYEIGEDILIGDDPKPKIAAIDLPKPDISPLPDEITPRIQAEHIKKS